MGFSPGEKESAYHTLIVLALKKHLLGTFYDSISKTRIFIYKDADFSINCGGPAVRSRDGTLYETENNTALGPAAYYVIQEKWAVSNAGVVIDRDNTTYITTTDVQVANTTTPELFRTSRTSPGSLRYYGLGLQNRTYTVSLFFAETLISDRSTQTWRSRGRRVFDIYIQVKNA